MRLIDADKLIAFIDKGKYCNPNVRTFSENDLCEMINEQPTAYDVGKVLEELRACSFEVISEDCYLSLDLDEAIDIVKEGAADDRI